MTEIKKGNCYMCLDAFIEKADKFISTFFHPDDIYLIDAVLKGFHKHMIGELDNIFPELKESEDERIKKAIHIYLDWLDGRNKDYQPKGDYSIKDMIAWLEKQGEQKPADKVEPRFKVGDWVVDNDDKEVFQIVKARDNTYRIAGNDDYDEFDIQKEVVEDNYHVFGSNDVKAGDVLMGYRTIFIAKKVLSDITYKTISTYISFNTHDNFTNINDVINTFSLCPATEEQRDLLFQKMHEAGYEWDADNKELKKIEQKPQRMISAEAKEAMYDKPVWSEEDEQHIDSLLKRLDGLCRNEFERTRFAISEDKDWLKSLKQRIGG